METKMRVTIQTNDDTVITYVACVEIDDGDPETVRKMSRVVASGVEMAFALLDAPFSITETAA